MQLRIFLFLIILVLLTGCAKVEKLGTIMKFQVQGAHYLETGNYAKGEAIFRQAVKEDPGNAQANYYLGRFLLARDQGKKALPYLEKAATINPNDADHQFWLGLAYGADGRITEERQRYEKALALDPAHLQALIYLGHLQLKSEEYKAALATYEKALEIWPHSPSALYNRALIMNILGRAPEEKLAWLEYLSLYPAGGLARRAADHLNMLEDFSYRNHILGVRTITLKKINFKPFTAELDSDSYPSLKLVGAIVSNMGQGKLQVVAYQKNHEQLARQRAVSIKTYLQDTFPDLKGDRIGISWFAAPDHITIDGKTLRIEESVRFFVTY